MWYFVRLRRLWPAESVLGVAASQLFLSSTLCARARGPPQVVYPILLVILCCRTFFVRVMPDALIMFKPSGDADKSADDSALGFLSRLRTSLREDHSLFAWADRGTWETVETNDDETRREGDQFRIGFEPLFVDFEKATAWFMVYSLVEVRSVIVANYIRFGMIRLFSMTTNCVFRTPDFHETIYCILSEPDAMAAGFTTSRKASKWESFPFILVMAACRLNYFQMIAIAFTAVMVDESAVQLLLFCGLHTLSFFLLVGFKPFANR